MIEKALTLLFIATCVCMGQQVGTDRTETHPPITTYTCTSSGCTSQSRALTLDANWRWLHNVGGSNNCYKGNTWVSDYCTDPDKCLTNCALDGADYSGTFGVTTSGSSVTLKLVTVGSYSTNIGSRLFVMASDSKYEMFKLLNKEFAFDVDVSNVPCGLNGALYLVEMDETGNKGVGNNAAGAKYGTGYCDAQCPHDIKYINGQANLYNWTGYSANSGYGMYGSCCGEMDVWESNKISAALTPHNCVNEGLYRCSGKTECGDGVYRYSGKCDKDGCDWNHYRMGNTDFYGAGKIVDTSKSFTVVTQFITADGTDTGELVEIRRYYKQSGVVIPNSYSSYSALSGFNSVTDNMCTASKSLFGDTNDFSAKGGMKTQGEMLSRGMVMVISLWEDYQANMLWLDATNYPTNGSSSTPGVPRGTCSTSSGVPTEIESSSPNSYVIFSNLKVGPFGTTTSGVPVPGSSESSATGTTNVDSSSPTTLIESESNTPEAESSITLTPADSEASMIQIGVATIAISVALIA